MNESMKRYLHSVLKRRLDMEAQRWFAALESGFDVAVIVSDELLMHVIENYLQSAGASSNRLNIELRMQDRDGSHRCLKPTSAQRPHSPQLKEHPPTLSILRHESIDGLVAITFQLAPLESLLPSPSTIVTNVLETANLERYVDAFDGQKMTQLRRLLEKLGPIAFFDAVIQVAYLAGYRGDDDAARLFLEEKLEQNAKRKQTNRNSTEEGTSREAIPPLNFVFDRILQLPDPHDVLKAALAHYVFYGRNITQAEASRLLKVSRSTLQAHLQLAERLNVAALFMTETHMA